MTGSLHRGRVGAPQLQDLTHEVRKPQGRGESMGKYQGDMEFFEVKVYGEIIWQDMMFRATYIMYIYIYIYMCVCVYVCMRLYHNMMLWISEHSPGFIWSMFLSSRSFWDFLMFSKRQNGLANVTIVLHEEYD